jgi:drug/metabolite transporter (DMT)-like permease
MNAEKFFKHPIGIMLAATMATLLWGSAFPFIKLSYGELGIGKDNWPEQLLFAGYRFVIASLLIFGFQTFLQYVFFYYGLSGSSGIQGSIIAGTTSFFQLLLAHFMYKNDRINRKIVIGTLLGFAGVILVNMTKGELTLNMGIPEICLLVAMFFGALGNVLSKNAAQELDVLYITSWQMLIGGGAMLLIGVTFAGVLPFAFTLKSIMMLLYLAFLSALGFVLWNNVMKYNKVGRISMYLFLVPVFGVILSALMLSEEIHLIVLLALGLVVSGIVIVNRQKELVEPK